MKRTFKLFAFALLAGSLMLTSCKKDPEENGENGGNGGTDITDATSLSGTISDNRTLIDLGLPVDYIVDGYLYLEGNAMLTVEPGVTIMFANESSAIIVEENQGIKMVGTADKPIVLTGPTNNQNKGSWKFIVVKSNRRDNVFEYVNFNNGGADDMVVDVEGMLSMKHCTINGSLGYGVHVGGDATLTAFENNTITNVNLYPISMATHAAPQLGTGNTYTSNGKNMIYLYYYWVDEENQSYTINAQPIPYYVSDGIGVDGNASLTLAAGVEMVFPYEKNLYVNDGCIFNVQGTETNPVLLRSMGNGNDEWIGVEFHSTRGGSSMSYCFIDGAGKDEAALYLDNEAKISLTNVTIRNSSSYGMSIYYDEENPSDFHVTSTGHAFINCASGKVFNRYDDQEMDDFPN